MKKKKLNDLLKFEINCIEINSIFVKAPLLINILNELAIKEKRRVHVYPIEMNSVYYNAKLIAYLSGIDINLVRKYVYPWYFHEKKETMNAYEKDKFISAIEQIGESHLYMTSIRNGPIPNSISNMLDDEEMEYIIIDNIDIFIKRTNSSYENVLELMQKYAQKNHTKFILFTMNKGIKFPNTIVVNKRKTRYDVEIVSQNEKFGVTFNSKNYHIEDIDDNYMTNFMSFYKDKKTYNIKKVLFVNKKEKEIEARCKKNVSFHDITDKTKKGKVFAWVEGKRAQKLYIASEGITKFPEDSSWLFAWFSKNGFDFNLFENVESFSFQNIDTSEVTDMSKMFSGLKNLKKINVKSFDTSKVKSMACMFLGCARLKKLDLSHFKIEKLECIIEMFNGCNSLKYLNIDGLSFNHLLSIEQENYDEVFFDLPKCIKIRVHSRNIMDYIINMNERNRPLAWNKRNFKIANKERKSRKCKKSFLNQ